MKLAWNAMETSRVVHGAGMSRKTALLSENVALG